MAAFRNRDYGRVRDLTSEGLQLSRHLGSRFQESIFLNNLGTAQFELGVLAAIELHQQAKEIAIELNSDHVLALTNRTLGADFHAQENFDRARQHLMEALRLYGRLGQRERESNLRQMMRRFGYLEDAESMIKIRLLAALLSVMVLAGCDGGRPSAAPTTAAPNSTIGDVAILVLDDFHSRSDLEKKPPAADAKARNCVYTGRRANEVGSGGGSGGDLPIGESHGDAVFQVLGEALTRVAAAQRSAPVIAHPSVSAAHVGQWRTRDASLLAVGVDDVVYRCLRLGPLRQRHSGRSRSLVRHHDRLHRPPPCVESWNWLAVRPPDAAGR